MLDFWIEWILISLAGGIVAVDTTSGWQILISQPLISCTLLGFMFGNPELGLLIGVLLEIPWMIEIPAGGARTSEGNLGAFVAAGIAIHFVHRELNTPNIIVVLSILWGLGVSWLGGTFVKSMRRSNVLFAYRADKAAEQADFKKITLLNIGGIGHAFGLGVLIVGLSFISGVFILGLMVQYIPPFFDLAFGYAKIGILGMGIGTLLVISFSKQRIKYLIMGLILTLVGYFVC